MDTQKPSILKILITDYIAFISLLFPLVVSAMYLFLLIVGYLPSPRGDTIPQDSLPFLLNLILIAAAVGIPIAIFRIVRIWNLFSSGVEVPGQIINSSFFRDRGRITYRYKYLEYEYTSGSPLHKTKPVAIIQVGDEVQIILDPSNPKRAIIKILYSN